MSEVPGLTEFDRELWPGNIPLLYYAYHVMVGLGTVFIAVMGLAALSLWRGRLFARRWLLWILTLSAPFPFIANILGWYTAELGRQPWLVYGVMRSADGFSPNVSAGNVGFTLLGTMGLYALLSLLFIFLAIRIFATGPAPTEARG
jgi:cytochrome d ubiquinol oxidase subunit I